MIVLDYRDRRPLYEQVTEKLEELMFSGVLPPDSRLPSVRSMATELSINPNTIQKAYAELERRGFIYTIKGRGNFVSSGKEYLKYKIGEIQIKFDKLCEEAESVGVKREKIAAYILGKEMSL